MAIGLKGNGFFGGALQPHKGDGARKFKALSSACQIVNERLMKCVQPETNKAELLPFMQRFSNHH
jgi:hypothetical protein